MAEVSDGERNLATVGIIAGLILVMDALVNHLEGDSLILGIVGILAALAMIDGGAGMIKGKEREREMLATGSLLGAADLAVLSMFGGQWMYLELGLILPFFFLGAAVHSRSRLGLGWTMASTLGLFGGLFLLADLSLGMDTLPDNPLDPVYLFAVPAIIVLVASSSSYLFGRHWGHWGVMLGSALAGAYYLTLAAADSEFYYLALPYLGFGTLFLMRGVGTGLERRDRVADYLSFRLLGTPALIPQVYVMGLLLISGTGIALLVQGFRDASLSGVYTVLIGLFLLFGGNILWRILCELGLVVFLDSFEEE